MGQRQGSSGSQPGLGLSLLLIAVLCEAPTMCQVRENTHIPLGQSPIQGPERQFHINRQERGVGMRKGMDCPRLPAIWHFAAGIREASGDKGSEPCVWVSICEWRMTQDVIEHGSSEQLKNTLETR